MTGTVPVYDWQQDGQSIGCGTRAELNHWTAEGVMSGVTLGAILTHEPASEDARRAAAWSRA